MISTFDENTILESTIESVMHAHGTASKRQSLVNGIMGKE
jgi:hypothetical protein